MPQAAMPHVVAPSWSHEPRMPANTQGSEGRGPCCWLMADGASTPDAGVRRCGRRWIAAVYCLIMAWTLLAKPVSAADGGAMDATDCRTLLSWGTYAKLLGGSPSCAAAPCSSFRGVTCDSRGRVVKLQVSAASLTGQLPGDFSALSALYHLDLSKNELEGTLPSSWSSLAGLSVLHLGNNRLTGTLPAGWSSCTNITILYVDNNKLTGTLPEEWSPLARMKMLGIYDNNLRGPIPKWFPWQHVTHLQLHNNMLTGTLPVTWSDFKSLKDLSLSGTQVSGSVPNMWQLLQNLVKVNTELTGALPWPASAVKNLNYDATRVCVPKILGGPCTVSAQQSQASRKKSKTMPIAAASAASAVAVLVAIVAAVFIVKRRHGGLRSMLPTTGIPAHGEQGVQQGGGQSCTPHPDSRQFVNPGLPPPPIYKAADTELIPSAIPPKPAHKPPTVLVSQAYQATNAAPPLHMGTPAPAATTWSPPPQAPQPSAPPLPTANDRQKFVLGPPVNHNMSVAPTLGGVAVSRHMQDAQDGGGSGVVLSDIALVLPLCIQLGLKIIELSQRVVANNARCSQLVSRITAMQPLLLQLQEQLSAGSASYTAPADSRMLQPVVGNIHDVFSDVHACVSSWCSPSRFGSIATLLRNMAAATWFQEGFVELNMRLSGTFTDLCTALHIQDRSQRSDAAALKRRVEQETMLQTKEDLKALAVELVSESGDGREPWQQLQPEEREKVATIFRHQDLDLTSTLREARKAALERTASALLIPPEHVTKERMIGRGGFGEVHAGTWKRAMPVAIKNIDVREFTDRDRDDMLREAFIHHRAHNHPNICQLYGVVMPPGSSECVMVMELANSDLTALISDRDVVLTAKEKYSLAVQVALGMEHLHAKKIVHGDLKPSNVLVRSTGRLAVSDFGLSTISCLSLSATLVAARTPANANDGTLAGSSTAVTLNYCPPELLDARTTKRTAAGDVYSFGAMLLQIFTGELPFGEMPYEAVLRHVLGGGRPGIPARVPAGCAQLIGLCWHRDPDRRPLFKEVVETLHELHAAAP